MDEHRQILRIFCHEDVDYSLSICGGKIMFALADRRNYYQYWIKDDRHCNSRKDSEGQPAFALVNYATGEAIKHCLCDNPLLLTPYNPDSVDDEVLWTMPKNMDRDITYIRRINDISLIFTASNHRVHDAKLVHLCHLANFKNSQRWSIVPYVDNLTKELAHKRPSQPTVKIYCQTKVDYSLTICNDAVMVVPSNPKDKYQHWIKDTTYGQHVKDKEKSRAFALVNKATGKALKHAFGSDYFVQLALFEPRSLEVSFLWTESNDLGNGFRNIRMLTNPLLALDAFSLQHRDWAMVNVVARSDNANQRWKIEEIKPSAISSI